VTRGCVLFVFVPVLCSVCASLLSLCALALCLCFHFPVFVPCVMCTSFVNYNGGWALAVGMRHVVCVLMLCVLLLLTLFIRVCSC
jgi:hypothetical protein